MFSLRFDYLVNIDIKRLMEEDEINESLGVSDSVKIVGIDFLLKILIFFFVSEF